MYLRANTVAAAEESIHFRLEVVQNHASNLFIWIHGSFACNGVLSGCLQFISSVLQYAPLQCILPFQGIA